MQQSIPTALGASVIIILAITAGVFLWQSEQGQPNLDQPVPYVVTQKHPRVVAPPQDVSMMGKEQQNNAVAPSSKTLPSPAPAVTLVITEQDLVGTWQPPSTTGNWREQYSIEKGKHIYKSFSSGKLDAQGTWSLDSNGMLSIQGNDGSYTLLIGFNQAKDEITITDEGTQSVLVKVALP